MKHWVMIMLALALVGAGCAPEDIDDDPGEGAAASGGEEGAEDVAEAAAAVVIGSYSASGTQNATNEATVKKIPVTIAGGQRVMIGTDGITGASNQGDTWLRLQAPTGDLVKSNNDDLCSNDFGSRLSFKSPYAATMTFTVWGGCQGNASCGPNVVAVSRLKGQLSFQTTNTNSAKKNFAKKVYHVTSGRRIRASTCEDVATGAERKGDTFLRLLRKEGEAYLQVASNDDSNLCSAHCGAGSTILYEVPSDGDYEVRAGCFDNKSCSGTVAV